jgi:cysteine desulfurase/selenocysteine lyase
MEHHANLVPWFQLAKKLDLEIAYLDIDKNRELILDNLDELLKPPTKLLAFPQVSNMLGTRNPANELCRKARQKGVLSLVDAAQSVPHFPVSVADLDCDFLVFSAHKAYGPSGVGVLYGKLDLLKKMPPFLGGGEMIREVTYEGFIPNEVPYKFEAGTQAIAEVHGLGLALDFLRTIGMENVNQHDRAITGYAFSRLSELPELRILSHPQAVGLVSFVADGVQSYDIADFLSDRGICVRAGHHCAEPLHRHLGVNTSLRASFGVYSTHAEIDLLVNTLKEAIIELT